MSLIDKNFLYKRAVLRQLYFTSEMSCAEISLQINKSIPLTNSILEELVHDGYVVESGFAPSSGGRRPLIYSAKPDMLYIVSVAMDQFVSRIVMMDMGNNYVTPVDKFELPLSKDPLVIASLAERIKNFIDKSGIDKQKIAGVGIGMPGFVDTNKGVNYTFLETGTEQSILEFISASIGLPVYIDNDSSLIALAELRFGSGSRKENVMVVNIGWGIGLGIIQHGEIFRGHDGFAGEFSHIPLFLNGKICQCGKTGCLETETSLNVVIEKIKEGLKAGHISALTPDAMEEGHPETNFEAVVSAIKKGDRFAIEIFSEAVYNIGRGVAILIHLLNPELIILSGRGSLAGKIIEAPVWQALNEYCIPRLAANTKVEISKLGYDAELIGAASLVMENFEKVAGNNLFKDRLQLS